LTDAEIEYKISLLYLKKEEIKEEKRKGITSRN